MKRPDVTPETLASKVAEGNLVHWLHYLKEDFDRFVTENRDLMDLPQKLAVVDTSDFLLRGIEDNAVKDFVFGRCPNDDRILHYLRVAVNVLNADTVEDALTRL